MITLFDLLFPKQCLGCKRTGSYLCSNCISNVPIVKQRCIVCEKPAIDGVTHPSCRGPHTVDRVISIWPYEGIVRKAILSLKYKFATEIAKEFSVYMFQVLNDPKKPMGLIPANAVLVPIPMHWQKQNWRGFNQTEVIGKSISKSLDLRYAPDVLIQTRKKQIQASLNSKERAKNIDDVFSLNPIHKSLILNPESIFILFDDVYTTGATLKEAGKVLKKAGVKEVWALTIAR